MKLGRLLNTSTLLIKRAIVFASFCFSAQAFAQLGPSELNISGGLFNANGTPVTNSSVSFKLEIYDASGTCILYSEDHLAQDLSASKGGFALQIGQGTSKTNNLDGASPNALSAKIFQNSGATGAFAGCAAGVTLSPGANRVVRVKYDLGSGYVAMSPDVPITSTAFSMVADTLQGKTPANFVQVRDDATFDLNQANVESIFSAANFAKLTALLTGSASNQRLTNVVDPTAASDAATKGYADGNVGGKVGDFTGVGPATGDGKTLIWDQAQNKWVTGVPAAVDASKLPLAGGTMTGAIAMGGQNITNIGHMTMAAQKTLNLGTYTTAQETTLIATPLTAADKGKIWFNSTTNKMMIWDGTAAVDYSGAAGAAGGDLTGTYPNPTIANGKVLTAAIANDAVTSAKINNTGIAVNRLLITDAATGGTVGYSVCAVGEVLKYGATGWTCSTVASLLGNSGVTAATYGTATQVAQVAVDSQGRVTSASNVAITFPVVSVAGKTGAVTLNTGDITNAGTAATKDYGAAAGNLVELDGAGKIPVGLMPGAMGDIQDVVAGSGLTGGGTSGAVTLSVDTGITTGKIVQIAASDKLPAVDGSNLTNINATKLQSRSVAASAPNADEVLTWNNSTSVWEPRALPAGNVGDMTAVVASTGLTGGGVTGDVTLSVDVGVTTGKIVQVAASDKLPVIDGSNLTNINAVQLQSKNVSTTAPTANQVLKWNNGTSVWEPAAETDAFTGTVTSVVGGSGLLGGNIISTGTLSVDVGVTTGKIVQMAASDKLPAVDGSNLTQINAVKLQARDVSSSAPAADQVLTWNGTTSIWESRALPAGNAGDVTAVVASTGLTGGGAAGDLTMAVDVGTTTGKIVQVAASNKLPVIDGSNLTGIIASQVSGAIANNGNSFGSAATLGTNDNFALNFETNNSTAMTILPSGNVGIGTSSPLSTLQVSKSSSVATYSANPTTVNAIIGILNEDTTNDNAALLSFQTKDLGGSTFGAVRLGAQFRSHATAAVSGDFVIDTINAGTMSEKLRITSAGDVGIGSANPAAKLDVAGVIRATDICDETGANCKDISSGWGAGGDIDGVYTNTSTGLTGGFASGSGTLAIDVGTTTGKIVQMAASDKLPAVNGSNLTGITASQVSGAFANNGNSFAGAAVLGTNDNNSLSFETNNATAVTITTAGDVGVGSTVPSARFDVESAPNAVTSGSVTNVQHGMNLWPASASSAIYQGTMMDIALGNSVNVTGEVRASTSHVYNNNTGTLTGARAAFNYVQNSNTGTITDAYGDAISIQNNSTGTITRAYGVNIGMANGGGGTIGNAYGVYIDNLAGTNKWGVYQLDASAKNYFNGNVGIGTTNPAVKLDVAGVVRATDICDESGGNCKDISTGWGSVTADIDAVYTNTATGLLGGFASGTGTLSIDVGTTAGKIVQMAASNKLPAVDGSLLTNLNLAGSSGFVQDGNSFSAAAVLGTNDNNSLNFETNGTTHATILPNGFFGVGTNNPLANFEVYNGTGYLRVDPNDGGIELGSANDGHSYIDFKGSTNLAGDYRGRLGYQDGTGFQFATAGGAVSMTLHESGNLGIGSTVPTEALDVVGNIKASGTAVTGGYIQANYAVSTVYTSTGTTSGPPGSMMNVVNNTAGFDGSAAHFRASARNGSGNFQGAYLGVASVTGATYTPNIVIGQQTGSATYAERMRIDASGNVGIGTTNPATKLDVNGTITATGFSGPLSTSVGTFGLGTVGAPSITFTGDTNTGWWSPGADILAASTAGVERLRIGASGNLAIGTTSTSSTLAVFRPDTNTSGSRTGVDSWVEANPAGASSADYLNYIAAGTKPANAQNFTGQLIGISADGWHEGTGSFASVTGIQAQAVKASTGAVTSAYALKVKVNNQNATGAITNAYGVYIDDSLETGTITNDYGIYQVDTGASNYFGGNVGIGTSAPAATLDVYNDTAPRIHLTNTTGNLYPEIAVDNYGNGTPFFSLRSSKGTKASPSQSTTNNWLGVLSFNGHNGTTWAIDGTGAGNAAVLATAAGNFTAGSTPTELGLYTTSTGTTSSVRRMTIDSSGNVGIGTTSPAGILNVSAAQPYIYVDGANATNNMPPEVIYRRARGTIAAPTAVQSGDWLMFEGVKGYGATGYAANPIAGISVVATENFDDTNQGTQMLFGVSANGSNSRTTRMVIDQNGNVGIGSSVPVSKLDVNGTITATGFSGPVSTSVGTFGLGTVGTPSLTFSGDTNTGWWSPAADTIAASTNGAERIRITSTGNVGIGTNNPTTPFQVFSTNTATSGTVNTSNTYTSVAPGAASTALVRSVIGAADVNSANNSGAEVRGVEGQALNSTTSTLGTGTGVLGYVQNTTTGTITNARGVFGYINNASTGTITTAKALEATIQNSGTITNAYGLYLGTISGTNNYAVYSTDSTAESYFNGKVGVGTNNPYNDVDINRTNADTALRVMNMGGATPRYPGVVVQNYIDTSGSGWPEIYGISSRGSQGTPAVTQSGDVLAVIGGKGTYDTSYNARFSGYMSVHASETHGAGSGGHIRFNTTNNGATLATEKMRITDSGFVGIGTTSPGVPLDVVGPIRSANGATNGLIFGDRITAGNQWQWYSNSNTARLYRNFNTAADVMSVDQNGKVGIATTAPAANLHVAKDSSSVTDMFVGDAPNTATNSLNGFRFQAYSDGNNYFDSKTYASGKTYFRTGQGTETGFARTWMTVDSTSGNVGIGTTTANHRLEINYPTTQADVSKNGISIYRDTVATANKTSYDKGIYVGVQNYAISSGVTDSGYKIGIDASTYSNDGTGFAGTLTSAYGVWARSGIFAAAPGGTITNAYGLKSEILSSDADGTIVNAYGVHIDNGVGTTAINNNYGLYQATAAAKNYFAGTVGIGTTNPGDTLDIWVGNSKNGIRIIDSGTGHGTQIQGHSPALNLNSYWDGAATRAIGPDYTGQIALNPNTGVVSMFSHNNPGAGNIITSGTSFGINPTGHGILKPKQVPASAVSIPSFIDLYSSFHATPADQAPRLTASIRSQFTTGAWGGETMIFQVGYGGVANDSANELIERMRITGSGNVGIGTTNPGTSLEVDGGLTVTPSAVVNLTADNQLVTVGNQSYIRLSSNNATSTNRTFCLTAGTTGQILILELTANQAEIIDGAQGCAGSPAAVNLNVLWTATSDDTLQLIYNGSKWIEISRSAN